MPSLLRAQANNKTMVLELVKPVIKVLIKKLNKGPIKAYLASDFYEEIKLNLGFTVENCIESDKYEASSEEVSNCIAKRYVIPKVST